MGVYRELRGPRTGTVLWRVRAEPGHRVLPDGALDLLWWRGRLAVAGPDTSAVLIEAQPGEVITGLRFPAGTAAELLGVSAGELVDTRVDLTDLVGTRGTGPVRRTDGPEELLEQVYVALWRHADPDRAVLRLVAALDRQLSVGTPVAAVAAGLGIPVRSLYRASVRAFGYGPKALARIRRFQRALDEARRGTPLAEVAAVTGYTDQAHLTREVGRLAGLPPRRLLRG
ncbi:helix-turn-helix domain-containing protein [Geodermatophilus sp. URMC 60]